MTLHAPNDGRMAEFSAEARESLRKQVAIEAAQTGEPSRPTSRGYFAAAIGLTLRRAGARQRSSASSSPAPAAAAA